MDIKTHTFTTKSRTITIEVWKDSNGVWHSREESGIHRKGLSEESLIAKCLRYHTCPLCDDTGLSISWFGSSAPCPKCTK